MPALNKDDKTNTKVFDVMPGADPIEALSDKPFDLNFGLGDEEVEEQDDDTEEKEEKSEVKTEDDDEEVEDPAEELEKEADKNKKEAKKPAKKEEKSDKKEDEVEEKEEKKEPVKDKKKSPMVPKSRLDKVLADKRALQAQVENLMAGRPEKVEAPKEFDFDKAEDDYMQAVLDGDPAKARQIRKDIRTAERAVIEHEVVGKASASGLAAQVGAALNEVGKAIEAEFPVFDAKHADFNKAYTDEVVAMRDFNVSRGMNPVLALTKAVEYVVKTNDLDSALEEEVVEEKPKKSATADRGLKKKIDAAEKQPNSVKGEGNNASKKKDDGEIDISTLSEADWAALPAATKARLRGDAI